jgi:hypothetical protein
VFRGAVGVGSSGYRTKILMMLRFAKEVRNGKGRRRRPAVVRGVDYDAFGPFHSVTTMSQKSSLMQSCYFVP